MATLTQVVTQIQTYAAALSGMRAAPSTPPEQISHYPFAVTAFRRGMFNVAPAGVMQCLGTFVCQIHVARKDLPRDYSTAMPFGDSFPAAIWNNPTLNSLVSTINQVRGTFAAMEWGGVTTIGWEFEIDVKMETTL